MPLTDILAAIAAETDAAVAEVDVEAERRARAVLVRARQRAAAEEQARSDRRGTETRRAVERIVNGARLEADRMVRDAKAAIYAEAHRLVEEQLAGLRHTEGYPIVLQRLVAEALARIPDACVMRVVGDDVALVRHSAPQRDLRIEGTLEGWGGVVAASDGRLVDNTLEGRLRRADPELRRVAGDVLPDLRAEAR